MEVPKTIIKFTTLYLGVAITLQETISPRSKENWFTVELSNKYIMLSLRFKMKYYCLSISDGQKACQNLKLFINTRRENSKMFRFCL